jgi:hypothetical protein
MILYSAPDTKIYPVLRAPVSFPSTEKMMIPEPSPEPDCIWIQSLSVEVVHAHSENVLTWTDKPVADFPGIACADGVNWGMHDRTGVARKACELELGGTRYDPTI